MRTVGRPTVATTISSVLPNDRGESQTRLGPLGHQPGLRLLMNISVAERRQDAEKDFQARRSLASYRTSGESLPQSQ